MIIITVSSGNFTVRHYLHVLAHNGISFNLIALVIPPHHHHHHHHHHHGDNDCIAMQLGCGSLPAGGQLISTIDNLTPASTATPSHSTALPSSSSSSSLSSLSPLGPARTGLRPAGPAWDCITYTAERRDVLGCTSLTTKRFLEAECIRCSLRSIRLAVQWGDQKSDASWDYKIIDWARFR